MSKDIYSASSDFCEDSYRFAFVSGAEYVLREICGVLFANERERGVSLRVREKVYELCGGYPSDYIDSSPACGDKNVLTTDTLIQKFGFQDKEDIED